MLNIDEAKVTPSPCATYPLLRVQYVEIPRKIPICSESTELMRYRAYSILMSRT